MRNLLLVSLLLLGACGPKPEPPITASPTAVVTPHEHSAPHGGTLIVFGEEAAHLELVVDQASGKISAYVLDGEAEKPVRLKQETLDIHLGSTDKVTLKAVDNALTGEKVGDTSEFQGESADLKGQPTWEGAVGEIEIQGTRYATTPFKFPEGNEEE